MTSIERMIALFFPRLDRLLFLTIFVSLVLFGGDKMLADGDTGWHIRAGEIMLKEHRILRQDMFSFHSPTLPWVAHEWLSEVIMAVVSWAGGLTGIVIFFAFILALTYWILYLRLLAASDNIIFASLLTSLVALASLFHWYARPHIFSLLIITIWFWLLDAFQTENKKTSLYIFPALSLIWTNLHGAFILGPMLLMVYGIGNYIGSIWPNSGLETTDACRKKGNVLMATTLVCVIASCINPIGYHIYEVPFYAVKIANDISSEFFSPNFHQLLILEALLVIYVLSLIIFKTGLDIIETGILLLLLCMALYSVRHAPLFAIGTSFIVSRKLKLFLPENLAAFNLWFSKKASAFRKIDSKTGGAIWIAIALFAVIYKNAEGSLQWDFSKKEKPVAAVQFMKGAHLAGNGFHYDEWGDYLIYDAYPQYRVFIDSRHDMYGKTILQDMVDTIGPKESWKNIIEKYKIGWMLLPKDAPLVAVLYEIKDWHLIYADDVARIFARDSDGNQIVIQNHERMARRKYEDSLNAYSH